MEEQTGVIELC